MFLKKITVLLLTFLSFPMLSHACSLVFWNDNNVAKVSARSMDLFTSDIPKLFVMPAGMERQGQTGKNTLKWTSQYGSVVQKIQINLGFQI
jgi:choloylglycine hydrolase